MECSDSRPSFPPHFVSFARRLRPRAPVFAPAKPDAGLGPGVLRSGHPALPGAIETETTGRPKFLGNPPVPMPCSLTPAGPGRTRPLRCAGVAPASHHHEGSPREVISGLNRTASALAVYASSGGSPHRTQDSLLVARPSSTRRASDPQGSDE